MEMDSVPSPLEGDIHSFPWEFPKENFESGSSEWMMNILQDFDMDVNVMGGEENNTAGTILLPSSGDETIVGQQNNTSGATFPTQVEENNTTLVDLELEEDEEEAEEDEEAAIASKEYGRKTNNKPLNITLEQLEPHFGKTLTDAAKALGVSRSTLKRAKDKLGIGRWPSHPQNKANPSLFKAPTSSDRAGTSKDEIMIIEVYHGFSVVKFLYNAPPKFDEFTQEVASKLHLTVGSFDLTYWGIDGFFPIRDDNDLQLSIKKSKEYKAKRFRESIGKVQDVDDSQVGANKSTEQTVKTTVRILLQPYSIGSTPWIQVGSSNSKRPRVVDHHRVPAGRLSVK